MFTAKIESISKYTIPETQETSLDVKFDIMSGNDILETRRLLMALTSTEEEVTTEVSKVVAAYESDYNQAQENKEVDEINKQADEVIKNLEGTEL